MPLSVLSVSSQIQWQQEYVNATPYAVTTQGPDQASFTLNGISLTTFNQLFTSVYTLAASASQTVDCTSLTNLVGESFGFGHVLSLMVLPTGSNVVVSPGSSNPLTCFFGGSTQSINVTAGGIFLYSSAATDTGFAVTSTAKTLKFDNSGSTSLSLQVVIVGSTT